MTKLKDTPIAGKLPKLKPQFLTQDRLGTQRSICRGRCSMHEDVLNTDIDINEVACFNLEKLMTIFYGQMGANKEVREAWVDIDVDTRNIFRIELKRELAKSGVLKWKE